MQRARLPQRRWILLSCALAFAVLTVVDISIDRSVPVHMTNCWTAVDPGRVQKSVIYFGMRNGSIRYLSDPAWGYADASVTVAWKVYAPRLGEYRLSVASSRKDVSIPLWFPLSALLGWLVWPELRWREKRPKPADS